jgi:Tfp pilus assembly protein PilF/predicted Zn-dependent protease
MRTLAAWWKNCDLRWAALPCAAGLLLTICSQMSFSAPGGQSSAQKSPRDAELDKLFAEGLQLLKSNHAFEAREVLERASALDPSAPSIHCNLGLAYQNSGNIERAITEFKTALQLMPGMPEATLNIAGCYQSLGQTTEAIGWYDRFMRENPSAPETVQIRDVIRLLREAAARPGSNPRLPDYLEAVTHDGTCRWPSNRLPIKVFIDNGNKVDGFRESFRRCLVEALDAWIEASGNKLAYTLVSNRANSDVVCEWTDNPADVTGKGTQAERGISHVFTSGNIITKGTLKILTRPTLEQGTLSDEDVKKACLHEVGHLLGLQGHSTNNHDVMFFTVDTSTVWPVLTKRDKLTMAKLYAGYAAFSKSSAAATTVPKALAAP